MTPVTRLGPRCWRCDFRPLWDEETGLCALCWHLKKAFDGAEPVRGDAARRKFGDARFLAWVAQGLAWPSHSLEFEAGLREWVSAE